MGVSVEMQHTGDPSVQAEVQLRGVPSVGHRFCPAKSTQLCSLGSSQSPLAVSFDALLGGFGRRLVARTQLSRTISWIAGYCSCWYRSASSLLFQKLNAKIRSDSTSDTRRVLSTHPACFFRIGSSAKSGCG